jgi:hypothetical protein
MQVSDAELRLGLIREFGNLRDARHYAERIARANGPLCFQYARVAGELRAEDGDWIPACNQTETPFYTRTGRRLLYCWQPATGKHAYMDLSTDMILTDEEARLAMQTW